MGSMMKSLLRSMANPTCCRTFAAPVGPRAVSNPSGCDATWLYGAASRFVVKKKHSPSVQVARRVPELVNCLPGEATSGVKRSQSP